MKSSGPEEFFFENISITNSISLTVMGLCRLFILSWLNYDSLWFWEIAPFLVSGRIQECIIVHRIPYSLFNSDRICSVSPCFIPESGDLHLLSLCVSVLLQNDEFYWFFPQRTSFLFHWFFLCCFSVFNFTGLYSYHYYFLPSFYCLWIYLTFLLVSRVRI